jgi:hypothetical protein
LSSVSFRGSVYALKGLFAIKNGVAGLVIPPGHAFSVRIGTT